ncbi:MAG: ABC transporter substrate-binding protein [Deltaproteobacteria bacterium]|nr:ABC transporter substrate-binding protein [Deltaproteobacteria bacterium]
MKNFAAAVLAALLISSSTSAQELIKLPFPYGPLGLNSVPFLVAKEAKLFEKHGLSVDMVYVGASAVMVQSMLSGAANFAGFGGPAVITNVLSGGDIIQITALLPYFTQSVIVRSDVRELRSLSGKRIGITRFGSVTDFALKTLLERNSLKDVTVLQLGGFPEAVAALIRGALDGAVLSPPHTFRLLKEGYRELAAPKDLRALGSGFLSQGIVARRSYAAKNRDVVLRLIRATVEGTKQAAVNEEFTKRLIGKYLGITDPELLRQSFLYVAENFAKDPAVPENVIQSMVQRMAQLNMIDTKAAQATPVSAYFDNSYVNELKQSGFVDAVWR